VFYVFFGVISGAREKAWPLAGYFQALTLHWAMLAVVIGLALAGSIVFTAPSSNATISLVVCVGILSMGRHLNKVALGLPEPSQSLVYAVYFALPHLELFDVRDLIIHNWDPIAWSFWAIALLYAAAYAGCFLVAAWLLFRRQNLA
jgi:ABC-type Na+ efflux pump permease subunit